MLAAWMAAALLLTQWLGAAHQSHHDRSGPGGAPPAAIAATNHAAHPDWRDAWFGHAAGDEACKLFDLATSADALSASPQAIAAVAPAAVAVAPPPAIHSAHRPCDYRARAPPEAA